MAEDSNNNIDTNNNKFEKGLGNIAILMSKDMNENFQEHSDKILNQEKIEKGKIAKSTQLDLTKSLDIITAAQNAALRDLKDADISFKEKKEIAKIITDAGTQALESGNTADVLKAIQESFVDKGIEAPIKELIKFQKDIAKKDQKVKKLKEKEAKQDEFKKKFSFSENVEKVKAFSKSAFDKIKGLILKGALFAIIMLLPKFLNSQLFKDILAAIEGDFSGLKQQFYDNWGKVTAAIGGLLLYFFPGTMWFIIKSIGRVLTNFIKGTKAYKAIIKGFKWLMTLIKTTMLKTISSISNVLTRFLKGGFMLIVKGFKWLVNLIRLAMLTSVSGIGGMMTGLLSFLAPILIAAAPFIAIAALLALAFVAIKALLDNLVKKLNVSSISDLIFIAWGYVQDGFASFVNMFIDLANMITGLVNKFGEWLGFDIDIPQLEKMSTDNAEKALKAAQLRKAEADRKAAEEDKQQALTQQSSVVANSGNTNISTNSSSVTNMVSQGMPDVSQFNNFNMDEALAMS